MALKLPSQNQIELPQEKKQKIFLSVLVVVIIATLLILYFGFLRSRSPSPAAVDLNQETVFSEGVERYGDSSLSSPEEIIDSASQKIKLDKIFLKSDLLKKLKIYGPYPFDIKSKGRVNPFLPY